MIAAFKRRASSPLLSPTVPLWLCPGALAGVRGKGKPAARPGVDPLWRAARAAFLPLKSLPKRAPKPADYRVNVAFKSHLLVQKARPRRQRHSQELLRGAEAVQLSCDVRIWPGLRLALCS